MKKTTTTNTGCLIALPNSTNVNAISLFIYFNLFNTCCVVGDERKLPKTRQQKELPRRSKNHRRFSQQRESVESERRWRLCCCCCLWIFVWWTTWHDLLAVRHYSTTTQKEGLKHVRGYTFFDDFFHFRCFLTDGKRYSPKGAFYKATTVIMKA